MTQPPYGDDPPPEEQPPPSQYPRQHLLPQEVKPGRSRLPLIVGAALLMVILVGALVAWRLLRDDGEQNRAAYCTAVRTLTHNGNLEDAVSGADEGTLAALERAGNLAPSVVKSQWDDLLSIAENPPTGEIDVSVGLRVLSDLRLIVGDANSHCDMSIQLPF